MNRHPSHFTRQGPASRGWPHHFRPLASAAAGIACVQLVASVAGVSPVSAWWWVAVLLAAAAFWRWARPPHAVERLRQELERGSDGRVLLVVLSAEQGGED